MTNFWGELISTFRTCRDAVELLEATTGPGAFGACGGVSLGVAQPVAMSGAAWAEVVRDLGGAAAAGGETENAANRAPNVADLAPVSQAGEIALATPSAAVKCCLRAHSMQ